MGATDEKSEDWEISSRASATGRGKVQRLGGEETILRPRAPDVLRDDDIVCSSVKAEEGWNKQPADNTLPLQTWNFSVQLNIPVGLGSTRDMMYRCTSTSIPESSIEQVSVEAHGVKLNFAGRRTWSGTWNATFFEVRDASTRDTLIKWMELARSWALNSGTYKAQYASTAIVTLYDDLPQTAREVKMYGVFPTSIGDVSLDQSSGIINYNVTLSYDFYQDA